MDRNLKRKLYTKAAIEVFENDIGCCSALNRVEMSNEKFDYFIRPENSINRAYNNGYYNSWWFGSKQDNRNQLARSLALLLMIELDK